MMTASERGLAQCRTEVQLRRFPYPYRCMLAICSDLDGTPGRQTYLEIMRFLNTTETTAMGPGLGLEVGNSIHFRALPPQFSYWDTDETGRTMVQALIHSGHIDCLHSFGELIGTRQEAQRALDELEACDCHLEVWVDHGGAVTNFGADLMHGHGDEIGHPAYHADLTIPYGIKYVWRGRTTSVVGQDVPPCLGGIWNRRHPAVSGRTLLKEAAKRWLAQAGDAKYAMHGSNKLLRRSTLRDERPIYEFMRCNPHWGGTGACAQGRYIGEVLTDEVLNRLVDREGTCALYTHLGKTADAQSPFDAKAVRAFRRLAQEFRQGRILVTTTRRLLGYRRATQEIGHAVRRDGDVLCIDVDSRSCESPLGALSEADWAGLTFYVPDTRAVCLSIDGRQVENLQRNPPDHTGRPSVSLPWPRLEFPAF